jgi:hypothetical protein
MTCDESIRLIARATEGRVAPGPLDEVVRHLEHCAGCCREAVTQIEVKRVLASRPFEPLPDRLVAALVDLVDRVNRVNRVNRLNRHDPHVRVRRGGG